MSRVSLGDSQGRDAELTPSVGEHLARVEDAQRIQRGLDGAHHAHRVAGRAARSR